MHFLNRRLCANRRLRVGISVIILGAAGAILTAAGPAAMAQVAPPEPASPDNTPPAAPAVSSMGSAIEGLRPAVAQVGSALSGLRVNRWKGSNDLRNSTQDDVASIQRDLSNALPPLMDQAQASTRPAGPVTPAFALFRNIDALYDVLLRVSETANLLAPAEEAGQLESARAALESARGSLGNALVSSTNAQDLEVARLRAAAVAAPKPEAAAAPAKIVVNDGPTPAATPAKRKKKKPATTQKPAPPAQPQQ